MPVVTHPCDRLLNNTLQAFERVARGLPANSEKAITDALVTYELIQPTVRAIGRDSLGVILRHGYSLPADVEAEWQLLRENCYGLVWLSCEGQRTTPYPD